VKSTAKAKGSGEGEKKPKDIAELCEFFGKLNAFDRLLASVEASGKILSPKDARKKVRKRKRNIIKP
jgi:hypothetical protein